MKTVLLAIAIGVTAYAENANDRLKEASEVVQEMMNAGDSRNSAGAAPAGRVRDYHPGVTKKEVDSSWELSTVVVSAPDLPKSI